MYRPVVAVGQVPQWRCEEARVSSVGRDGGLGWRPGGKRDRAFRSGREWRLDGDPVVEHRVSYDWISTSAEAAALKLATMAEFEAKASDAARPAKRPKPT